MSARSSPGPNGGRPFRPIEKAPPVSKRERAASNNTRNMGLKVLYTIDGNDTNCLARWNGLVSVQTAAIDERSLIGLVEYKTCIQAVIQSSPEIISQMGRDYTVYAFDYSEPDIPQSGQGMLSWALAPDAQSQSVTGRVLKNTLGLFSKGGDETLEVRLRLVPVKTTQQHEYLNNMDKSRQPSMQAENIEWNTLMNSQPGLTQLNQLFGAQPSEMISRQEFAQIVDPSAARVRASTPIKATQRGKARSTSRPSSRNSVKRPPGRPRKHPIGNISGSEDVGTDGDDGPPRKRVKPSEAEHDGTSTFGDPESLRIRASTAASIRGDMRSRLVGGESVGNGSQELPRAPTPVPNFPLQISTRDSAFTQSSLRRESMNSPSYISPYSDTLVDSGIGSERIHKSIESAISSPECHGSPSHTLQDIGSSPPELSGMQPPSSPILPQMPRREDSAYGGSGGLFGEEEDDLCLNDADGDDNGLVSKRGGYLPQSAREAIQQVGSPAGSTTSLDEQNLPPHSTLGNSHPNSPYPQENMNQVSILGMAIPSNDPTTIPAAASTTQYDIPSPRVSQVHREGLARAASFSTMPSANTGDMSIPLPTVARSQTEGPQLAEDERAGSEPAKLDRNFAKKTRILSRLEQSVADGKTPDFCFNCGSIKTPTWRKAFTQEHQGDPGFIEYSDEPGRIMAIDVLSRDETGRSTSYRLYKKSLLKDELFKDFKAVNLCNACGMWVSKYKSNRPKEKWMKAIADPLAPPKRKPRMRGKRRTDEERPRNKKKDDNTNPTSEAYGQSEAYFPSEAYLQSEYQSEGNFLQSEAPAPVQPDDFDNNEERSASVDTQAQYISTVVHSTEKCDQDQKSEGSRHSPIQLDGGFGNTRRVLFPSPRKDGSPKLLGDAKVVFSVPQLATDFTDPKEHTTRDKSDSFFDQENCPPTNENSISALFGDESPARLATPTRSNPPPNPFKTPTRPSPNHRPLTRSQSKSASARKSTQLNQSPSRTPVRRSPRHRNDLVETPMTYINRMFSQPVGSNGVSLEDMDFSMPDMPEMFISLNNEDHADYLRAEDEDPWNNIQYDILGGHGDVNANNEDLGRLLEIALHAEAVRNSTNSSAFMNDGGEELSQEVTGNGTFESNGEDDGQEMNEPRNNTDELQLGIKEEIVSPMPTF